MKIIIDNGHGIETPGKRSPDGRFREYAYNRTIAHAIYEHLLMRGYDVILLVPEANDITLTERVCRANKITCRTGSNVFDTILVSIHVNAAGDGSKWLNATGWSAYTSPGHTQSDELASCLYRAAEHYLINQQIRKDWSDDDPDIEAPFYLLKHTYCPAVLTENLFMDCRKDLSFLESTAGQKMLVALHVEGIIEYISQSKHMIVP